VKVPSGQEPGEYRPRRSRNDIGRIRIQVHACLQAHIWCLSDRNHSANHSTEFALGAEYSLSRRTLAYAQVGYVTNRGTMNQTIIYGAPVAPGVNTTAAMIGIRHGF
jgi:predicted porin